MELKIQKPIMLTLISVTVLLFIASAFCVWLIDKHDYNGAMFDTLLAKQRSIVEQLHKIQDGPDSQTEPKISRQLTLYAQSDALWQEIDTLQPLHEVNVRMKNLASIFFILAIVFAFETGLNLCGKPSITSGANRIIQMFA